MKVQHNDMTPGPFSIIYDILSLTNSTLLTTNVNLLCTKETYSKFVILILLSMEKYTFACWFGAMSATSDVLYTH
jgi:hypothetical protein